MCTNAHVGNNERAMGCFGNTICIKKDRDQSTRRGHFVQR